MTTEPSSLASAAPMQKWAPPPKLSGPASGLPGSKTPGSAEPAGVPITRSEQRGHSQSLGHRDAAELGVVADPAGELDGRVEPQHFFDEGRRRDGAVAGRGARLAGRAG